MAKVKLSRNRFTGPVIVRLGGKSYSIASDEHTEMPVGIAISFIGDEGMVIEFDTKDEKGLAKLNTQALETLGTEFGCDGTLKAVKATMFPKKRKSRKKSKPVVVEIPEEIGSEEE